MVAIGEHERPRRAASERFRRSDAPELLVPSAGDFVADVERVYRTEGARLWRSVAGYAGSRAVADDAVAEAFAQLLRRGPEVLDPKAWVWRAAFRIAAGDLQRQRRDTNELLQDFPADVPVDSLDLVAALRTLSDMQRKSVVLHDYTGYRAAEVARMIGSTEAAVRVHLLRGRKKLRSILA